MDKLKFLISSQIGRKQLVAISGLLLSGFILTHMSGNLLLFKGAEAYNHYSHLLVSNPMIYIAEAVLALIFLAHMGLALKLARENKLARHINPTKLNCCSPKSARFASTMMVQSGLLVFVFLILHLICFKYGAEYTVNYNGVEVRDIYRLVNEKFHDPLYVVWYVISLLVLGMHLWHGLSATVQTLGVSTSRCKVANCLARLFIIVVIGGFISQPIYLYFCGVN